MVTERPLSVTQSETLRVLVVEDETHIANFIRMGLTHEGF